MKQKTLSIRLLLAGLFLPTFTSLTLAAPDIVLPSGNSSIPQGTAKAYYDVLNEYIETIGTTEDQNTGLAFSRLIDFDQDGKPELYLLYVQENQGTTEVIEELWSAQVDKATRYHQAIESESTEESVQRTRTLLLSNDSAYLWVTEEREEEERGEFYIFNGKSCALMETLTFSEDMAYRNGEITHHKTFADLVDDLIMKGYQIQEEDSTVSSGESLTWLTESCYEELEEPAEAPSENYCGYPWVSDETITEAMETSLEEQLNGPILAAFQLSEELFYLVVEGKKNQESHIIYQGLTDGQPYFGLYHSKEENMEAPELWTQISRFQNKSNIVMDYSPLWTFTSPTEFSQHLDQVLNNTVGLVVNQHGRKEIAQYLELVLQQMATLHVYASEGQISLLGEDFATALPRMQEQKILFDAVLIKHNANPNRTLDQSVQVVINQMSLSQGLDITLDQGILAQLPEEIDLQIRLAESPLALYISRENLKLILSETGDLTINLSSLGQNKYSLSFTNEEGKKIESLPASFSLSLPASSPFDTVYYEEDNWGGQWDEINESITLSLSRAGDYLVEANEETILDIKDLSEEEQKAIEFMVSRGYFALEEGEFHPQDFLSRYDFAVALVGIFYALDREARTNFMDVEKDSPYYAYVASAQMANLMSGYNIHDFAGDLNITQEQVLSAVARSLSEDKGYQYPTNLAPYLNFSGANTLSDWAEEGAALCMLEGIILRGETVWPQYEISRGKAALYLYRLFQLLYEPSPVSVVIPETIQQQAPTPVDEEQLTLAVATGWTALFGAVLLLGKAKKKKGR